MRFVRDIYLSALQRSHDNPGCFTPLRYRTELFENSFLLFTVNDWSKLDPHIRNVDSSPYFAVNISSDITLWTMWTHYIQVLWKSKVRNTVFYDAKITPPFAQPLQLFFIVLVPISCLKLVFLRKAIMGCRLLNFSFKTTVDAQYVPVFVYCFLYIWQHRVVC